MMIIKIKKEEKELQHKTKEEKKEVEDLINNNFMKVL